MQIEIFAYSLDFSVWSFGEETHEFLGKLDCDSDASDSQSFM